MRSNLCPDYTKRIDARNDRNRRAQTFELKLPSQLRTRFNGLQEQYGFVGRAGPL